MADLNADLDGQLASLGFLLDAAAASPQAFDLETVLGRARRAVAALQAVLELAAGPAGLDVRAVREAVLRELPYGSPYE